MGLIQWAVPLLTVTGFLVGTAGAQEAERILNFHADIGVEPDASLKVVETIEVYAAGDSIKRGIYRDVPYRGLEPDEVLVDGSPSPYHTESYGDGTRIYIGDAHRMLSPGTYTYTIGYRVPLEVRFYDEHDRVYWNVTGNEWAFPIERATATIVLPEPIDESSMPLEGWTGRERSTATAFEAEVPRPGEAFFATTAPLEPGEGLTIRITFPKGLVEEPSPMDVAVVHLRQLGFTGIEAVVIGLIAFYLFVVWALFGKDPSPGRVLPTDQPPHGFSPAACRYIQRMGYDQKAFTAALVSMATKGYLRIERDNDGDFVLVRDAADESVLSKDERALAKKLLDGRSELTFTKGNRSTIQSGMKAFRQALGRQNEKEYFKTNSVYLLPSFAAGVIALIALALSGTVAEPGAALFLCVWLSVWTLAVIALAGGAMQAWAEVIRLPGLSTVSTALGATLFFAIFGMFELFALWALTSVASLGFALTLMTVAVLHAIFYQLMKAPTSMGRRFLDELEGFEMYLDGENLTRFAGGDPTQRFERYLPYAIALGKEVDWTRSFEAAAESATTHERSYSPTWYHGHAGTASTTGLIAGLGASLSSAVSGATATSSSSSGGGGGGSSGGGGGGGGGGGW